MIALNTPRDFALVQDLIIYSKKKGLAHACVSYLQAFVYHYLIA